MWASLSPNRFLSQANGEKQDKLTSTNLMTTVPGLEGTQFVPDDALQIYCFLILRDYHLLLE